MCCSIVCLPAYLPSPISCTIVRNQCVSAHCTYYHDHQLLDPSRSCSGGGGGFAHSQTLESEWEAASHHLLIVLARGLSLVASRPSACRLRRCSFLPLSPLSPSPHERQRRRYAHCTTSPIERSRQEPLAYLATHARTHYVAYRLISHPRSQSIEPSADGALSFGHHGRHRRVGYLVLGAERASYAQHLRLEPDCQRRTTTLELALSRAISSCD